MQFAHGDLLKLLLSCSVFWPAPVGNKCAEIWRRLINNLDNQYLNGKKFTKRLGILGSPQKFSIQSLVI